MNPHLAILFPPKVFGGGKAIPSATFEDTTQCTFFNENIFCRYGVEKRPFIEALGVCIGNLLWREEWRLAPMDAHTDDVCLEETLSDRTPPSWVHVATKTQRFTLPLGFLHLSELQMPPRLGVGILQGEAPSGFES